MCPLILDVHEHRHCRYEGVLVTEITELGSWLKDILVDDFVGISRQPEKVDLTQA